METLVAAPCRECSIYALCDPHTGEVRYVGKADRPARRFRQHLEEGQLNRYKSRKNSWIKGLLAQGLEPILDILDVVPADQANHAEREYIGLWRYLVGDRLLNGTDGGDGGAVTDPEAKARILAAHLGTKASAETRARMSESAKRRAADPKERERLRSISTVKPPVRRGEANNKSVLSDQKVRELRERHAAGEQCWQLADAYGLTRAAVGYIVSGYARAEAGGPVRPSKPKQRLSVAQVEEIRARVNGGERQRDVALAYGVDPSHVNKIVRGNARKGISPNKED